VTRVRYAAISNPKERFERMRPTVAEIDAMLKTVKPFGPDYCVLLAAREALQTAAFHFTREPYLFGSSGT
jgi:hypothetical protein